MDEKLTAKIQAYLDTPAVERNVIEGATMLLSLNRNKVLFQNVVRRPDKLADKVEHELKKHLAIRLDKKTLSDVARMNKTVLPAASSIIETGAPVISTDDDKPQEGNIARGKRADHNALPDEIKVLWDENAQLWFKIKETFEQLKGMEDAPACDRFEYLKLLEESDRKYRDNMNRYDSYVIGAPIVDDKKNTEPVTPADVSKQVNADRKYLSDNKKKLAELKESDPDKYNKLLVKVQERFDRLVTTGNHIDAAQMAELAALGLKVE